MQNIQKKITHEYNFVKSKSDQVSEFSCRVNQLNESEPEIKITVSRDCAGQWLLDEVCERLGSIQEKDYFGLRYTDKDKQRQWLDLGKNIYSQLKDSQPLAVSFRIKHYPASPFQDLNQNIACTCLYLQLRRDLFNGKLLGKSSDLYQLAAYAAQRENGDFDSRNEDRKYISNLKLLPNLHTRTEAKIVDIHKTLAGLSKEEAEYKFLETACQLDTYGVEPFYVKDQKGNNLYVGLTHEGVSTFQGSRRAHLFKWADITKIHYQGKLFIVQVYLDEVLNNQVSRRKHVLGFKCETTYAACALWKWANDRLCFFSLNRSSEAKKVKSGGGIFKKRKTFRFSGRCQHEMIQMSSSMMQINEHGSMTIRHSGTLLRGDAVQDDFFVDDKPKFDTLPSRDRGTQETLDSLFKEPGAGDFDSSQSTTNSTMGSPRTEKRMSHTNTQSLEHIIEEPQVVSPDSVDAVVVGSSYAVPKRNISQTSSTKSSSNNLSPNTDVVLKRKLSANNGDIAGALEQLNLAVSEAVNQELTKVVKRNNLGRMFVRFMCLGCLLLIGLLLLCMCGLIFMTLVVRYRGDSAYHGYSDYVYDIMSKPSEFLTQNHLSRIARNCYFQFSNILNLRSSSKSNE